MLKTLQMRSRGPIYAQIQEYLRNSINEGIYKAGERLPSESELAERFATTRATVARALQQLVFEGVITRKVGSGTFVSEKRLVSSVDTRVFQSFEEHMRESGETIEYEVVSYDRLVPPVEIADRLKVKREVELYHLQRLRLLKQRPLGIESRYLPYEIGVGIKTEWLEMYTIQEVLQQYLGLSIHRIENEVRAAPATAEIAAALGIYKGTPLLVREHTMFGANDRPLLFGKTSYVSSFSFNYTLTAPANSI